MESYRCIEVKSRTEKKMFLDFPSNIYFDGDCPQDYKTEKLILDKKHPISCDIEIFPYIVFNEANVVVCRCILTYYKDDPVAYVGFFEAYQNVPAVRKMFCRVEKKALKDGKNKIIGPIDASIYINYRFKVDRFDKTYTSEPYNKNYYAWLWERAGFAVCDKYMSNQIRQVQESDIDEKLKRIYERYVKRDYQFVSPTDKTYEKCLEDVYCLMMKLYKNFSGFKMLTKEQFMELFMSLKKVLNFSMVKIVYNKDIEPCAFCICVPNYGRLTKGKLTLKKIKKIKELKNNPNEYVVLYLGADTGSVGLGGALVHLIRNELYKNKCTSIGALIKEGNVTGKMYEGLYVDQFNYVLLEKKLTL